MLHPFRRPRVSVATLAAFAAVVSTALVAALFTQSQGSSARADLTAWNGGCVPGAKTWDGGGADDKWTTALNWADDVAPSVIGCADVTIPGENADHTDVVITGIPYMTMNSLTLLDPAGHAPQHLTTADDSVVSLSGTMSVTGGGTLTLGALSRVELTGAIGATIAGDGSLSLNGGIDHVTTGPDVDVSIADNGPVTFQGSPSTFAGQFTEIFGDTVTVSGASGFTNSGSMTVDPGANIVINNPLGVTNSGTMTFAGSAQVSGSGSGALTNAANATLVTDPGAGAMTAIERPLVNNGAIDIMSGVLSVGIAGAGPAQPFTAGANSSVNVHLFDGAGSAGTSYSQLLLSDTASLAGKLTSTIEGSYAPASSATFNAVTFFGAAGSRTGDFVPSGTGFDQDGSYVANTPATDTFATLDVRKASTVVGGAHPGESFTISGSGYLASEPVLLVLAVSTANAGGEISEQTVNAGADGTFSSTVAVPADGVLSGNGNTYYVSAVGQDSGAFVQKSPDVTAKPVVITPVLDADGDGLVDSMDCAPNDAAKPKQGTGVVDADCNGVNDAIQPIRRTGGTGNNKFTGKGGNDVFNGGAGNDTLNGAGGNDRLLGGRGNDRLFGGLGIDTLLGGAGNDVEDGGAGNDRLSGDAGNDRLAGGVGNDRLNGGAGRDRLNGGTGNDTINSHDRRAGDTVSCGKGKDVVVADKKDKVSRDCERVIRH
jgi:Ca2+-binding RTX toxin-like protein